MANPKHPKVFRAASKHEWPQNALVGWTADSAWLYSEGYVKAAEIAVEHALAARSQDLLFYPICYLYRHALEVTLKELIRETERLIRLISAVESESPAHGQERDAANVDDELKRTHSLGRLFDTLAARLKIVSPDQDLPTDIRAAVIEVHNVDPSGEVFRYAKRQDGSASFPKHQAFDLKQIRDRLGPAVRFLADGVGGWLSNELDQVNAYIADLESGY